MPLIFLIKILELFTFCSFFLYSISTTFERYTQHLVRAKLFLKPYQFVKKIQQETLRLKRIILYLTYRSSYYQIAIQLLRDAASVPVVYNFNI